MTDDFDLSIHEIDNLLQHLYVKLKGKKEGLSLAEPAAMLLAHLKKANPPFYSAQLDLFTPIIMDTLMSGAYVSFGYEGLLALHDIAGDVDLATGDYVPDGVEKGLSDIGKEIESIYAVLRGRAPDIASMAAIEQGLSGKAGSTRDRAWGTANIPLISSYNTGSTPFSTGRVVMVRLEVRLTGEWSFRGGHDPVISFEHISAEPNGVFERQIRTALVAGERYASRRLNLNGLARVPREYRISLPEIASFPARAIQRLTGGSAGLAVATLLVSVLSRLDLQRESLLLRTDRAFTGAVDETGRIETIDETHIAEKVRAVFYSRNSGLILPAENLATAEKALGALREKHPARGLDLIPAATVDEVLDDPAAAGRKKVRPGKPLLRRMFFWRKHLLAAGSLAAAAAILLTIVRPYFSLDIADARITNKRIEIKNAFGRTITSYDPGFKVYGKGETPTYSRVIKGDFDGNGADEAVCIISESRYLESGTDYDRMHFISFGNDGKFRFDFIYDDEKLMGEDEVQKLMLYERTFPICSSKYSRIFKTDGSRSHLLGLIHHQSHKPGSVVNLDPEDGSAQVFLHQGYLSEMILRDVDGDGSDDIVLAGYNNILKSSVVVVLDHRYMQGSSPEGADYDADGFDKDIAKYYLRLPGFYRYINYDKNRWFPLQPKIETYQSGFSVRIKNSADDAVYFFGAKMRCDRVDVLESASARSKKFDADEPYEYPGIEDDKKDLREGIRYWDGTEWVSEPTMNRSFLEYSEWADDSKIDNAEIIEGKLIFRNTHGYIVSSYDTGIKVSPRGSYRKIFFGDFLEDDGDEIACVLNCSPIRNTGSSDIGKILIFVFDDTGALLRRFSYDEAGVLGGERGRNSRKTSMQLVLSSDHFSDQLGPGRVFIGTHHKTESPACIIGMSLEDGSHEVFLHRGFLRKITARDVDGDGKAEIVAAGYNVDLESPVIVVLDPDHLDGSSPGAACYDIPGREEDIAKYYIRLPDYAGFEKYLSNAYSLHADLLDDEASLRVLVVSRAEDVLYTIGPGMRITDVDVVLEQNQPQGMKDTLKPAEYEGVERDERELLEGVRYWDGEKWVDRPAVNGAYLRHIRKRS